MGARDEELEIDPLQLVQAGLGTGEQLGLDTEGLVDGEDARGGTFEVAEAARKSSGRAAISASRLARLSSRRRSPLWASITF